MTGGGRRPAVRGRRHGSEACLIPEGERVLRGRRGDVAGLPTMHGGQLHGGRARQRHPIAQPDPQLPAITGKPDPVARLHRRAILSPGTLAHTNVYWTHLNSGGVSPRCPSSMQQEQLVRAAWSDALSAAGAQSVSFHSGPVVLRNTRTDESPKGKE